MEEKLHSLHIASGLEQAFAYVLPVFVALPFC